MPQKYAPIIVKSPPAGSFIRILAPAATHVLPLLEQIGEPCVWYCDKAEADRLEAQAPSGAYEFQRLLDSDPRRPGRMPRSENCDLYIISNDSPPPRSRQAAHAERLIPLGQ